MFDALVLNFRIKLGVESRLVQKVEKYMNSIGGPLRTKSSQTNFLNHLKAIGQKITTSHVVAEVFGLQAKKLDLQGLALEDFWQTSIDLITQWKVEERLVPLLDLASAARNNASLLKIGVTDTGVIDLAEKERCILITWDERTLGIEALRRDIECRFLNHFLALD